ncbi:MFS transporter [Pseudonocardia nematodicida]|uniref:MFS transporter n=1 Tax=Pseudonocardia nematodicida TaxID=1206997 RepID=UPI00360B334D
MVTKIPRRTVAIVAVMISATVYTVVQGLTYPLLSLLLANRGVPEWEIGLNSAMMPVGMLIAAVIMPRIVATVGLYRTCVVCLSGVSVCLSLIAIIDNHWLWAPLRLVTGVFLATIFIATDTWINNLAVEEYRGRTVGIYSMLLSIGFAVGPGILAITGATSLVPFIVVVLLPLASLIPLIWARSVLPTAVGDRPSSIFRFFRHAPVLLLCVGVAAYVEQAAMSFLPLYGLLRNFSEGVSSTLLVAMIAGSVVLMYPIGWLADRINRIALIVACAMLATVFSAMYFIQLGVVPALIVSFAWGGLYYGIYTLSLIWLGQRFTGSLLIAGTAACSAVWGIGGLFGSPAVGASMQVHGAGGFALGTAVALVFLVMVLLARQLLTRRTTTASK